MRYNLLFAHWVDENVSVHASCSKPHYIRDNTLLYMYVLNFLYDAQPLISSNLEVIRVNNTISGTVASNRGPECSAKPIR